MALLEAMWFDCPCLVSDIPENVEVLEGRGEVFPVGNVEALRAKMQVGCDVWPAREDTRSVVAASHDWEKVTDETLRIYEEVLA